MKVGKLEDRSVWKGPLFRYKQAGRTVWPGVYQIRQFTQEIRERERKKMQQIFLETAVPQETLDNLRIFKIIAWISIPTVMYGGYALLGFLTRGKLTGFQINNFRAGHAHAGVLLLMSLLYLHYVEQTSLSLEVKIGACVALVIGILAQSGGFFLHLLIGRPNEPSWGTRMTIFGAMTLAGAVLILVYGLLT
jgi:hypothetical protein